MDAQSTFTLRKSGSVFHLSRTAPAAIAAGPGASARKILRRPYQPVEKCPRGIFQPRQARSKASRGSQNSGLRHYFVVASLRCRSQLNSSTGCFGWLVRRATAVAQRCLILAIAVGGLSSLGANQRTANFIVSAPTPAIAQQIAQAAEQYRQQLAVEWLGREMPTWAEPCPITVQVGDHLGAGGATSFMFERGEVYGWRMTIQGSLERILDSVLPHEVTHTVFATHFRRPLPRWADEGACTTVEHASERAKQQVMLVDQLRTHRGIAFSQMFAMKEYPHDVMPLYSQGYSVARYLIAQGGKQKFLTFLGDGMRDENWSRAVKTSYDYADLAVLQQTWLDWVKQGSPNIDRGPAATTDALASARTRPEPNLIYRGQNGPPNFTPAANPAETNWSAIGPTRATDLAGNADQLAAIPGRPTRRTDGWHAPGAGPEAPRATSQGGAGQFTPNDLDGLGPSAVGGDTGHEMTRPQPAQQARQIILEWSKGQPAAPPLPGPPPVAGVSPAAGAPQASSAVPSAAGTRMAGGTASVYGSTVIR